MRDTRYPKADDYFFKPLNEHVPVYQKPFRVIQDVTIDPSREAERAALRIFKSMTIDGQARLSGV